MILLHVRIHYLCRGNTELSHDIIQGYLSGGDEAAWHNALIDEESVDKWIYDLLKLKENALHRVKQHLDSIKDETETNKSGNSAVKSVSYLWLFWLL